jgi:hypothetical protein
MALSDYKPILQHVLLRMFTIIFGPVAFIYAMLTLRILFWPFLVGIYALVYLYAEYHYRHRTQRRRWRFWEPKKAKNVWGVNQ